MKKTIKLSAIVEEIGQMDGMEIYLHKPTGRIYHFFEGESEFESVYSPSEIEKLPPEQKKEVEIAYAFEENEADFLPFPSKYEVNEYQIMEKFSYAQSKEHVQDSLLDSIKGKGAFRRFRATVDRFNLTEKWYAFREAAFYEIAIEWCIEKEIAFIDDRPASKSSKKEWPMDKIVKDWEKNAAKKTDYHFQFLTSLKFKSANRVDKAAAELHQEAFEKIDCTKCANCCKTAKPTLFQDDIDRISQHLGISIEEMERDYLIPEENEVDTWEMNATPCPFLSQENLCTIYEVRPFACKDYPNTQKANFTSRRFMHTANTSICPASYYIVERMKEYFGG